MGSRCDAIYTQFKFQFFVLAGGNNSEISYFLTTGISARNKNK